MILEAVIPSVIVVCKKKSSIPGICFTGIDDLV